MYLLLPLLVLAIEADNFTGKVIAVKDGDSIVVLRDKEPVEIRLLDIDCPEFDQAFGRQATKRTAKLCLNKTVTVKVDGKDKKDIYDRTLAHVFLPDGKELNRVLVSAGLAWANSKDASVGLLQAKAKKARQGIWSDKDPTAPWDWRAAQRAGSAVAIGKIKVVPNGVRIVALLPNPQGRDPGNEQVGIANATNEPVNLRGWRLIDKSGNVFLLAGKVDRKSSLTVTMKEATMPLNNNGDEVLLVDAQNVGRSRVAYTEKQVQPGVTLDVDLLGLRIGNRGAKKAEEKPASLPSSRD